MKWNLKSISLVVALLLAVQAAEEVKLVVELARHGARVPIYEAFTAPWMEGIGRGELTPVGLRQHYYLGREMASAYPSIFGGRLPHNEFHVRSSQFQRTTTSAMAHMMGLWDHFEAAELAFPNGDDRIEPPEITHNSREISFKTPLPHGLIPTVVHTETVDEDDTLFLLSSLQCPTGTREAVRVRAEIGASAQKNPAFLAMVKEAAARYGIDLDKHQGDKFEFCVEMGDFALQDARNNPAPKIAPEDPLLEKIGRCYQASIIGKYTDANILKAISANLMEDILGKLKDRSTNPKNAMKYYLFTAHDSTLSPLLMMAGKLDASCFIEDMKNARNSGCKDFPDTASNIVFELVYADEAHYVRMNYNFEPLDFCGLGNGADRFRCPLELFDRKWRALTNTNWRTYCGTPSRVAPYLKNTTNPWRLWAKVVGGALLFCLIVFVALAVDLCILINRKKQAVDLDSSFRSSQEISIH